MRVKWHYMWDRSTNPSTKVFKYGRVIQFLQTEHYVKAVVLRDSDGPGQNNGGDRFVTVNIEDLRVDPPDRL